MTWVLWVMVPMAHTPRGRSGAAFVKALGQIEYGQFCHFLHLWTQLGSSPRRVAWRSLRAKGMGVSVGLPVDHVWNAGSDLQAGVEIYYWEHTEFWPISSSQNDPILGPQFPPSVWSIGGPISLSP